ncbi:cupredoxin domain-containing protein [Anaerobacillus isosaccharinicus]|nr:hypothetical protein [Anaerobacillus isosaccharinicus]MBA5586822.1 cytochrome C oxidase subunit II [Anaerobacillus isosaccharinicus]QOY34965.1 cytochrome C oxidase subunit II [Anaerobacillus isosaccharinicus]
MKKLVHMIISLTVVATLVACGGDKDTAAPATETPAAVETNVEAGDKEFTITAKNFEFETSQDLVVKKGDQVTIKLDNVEGAHGLEIAGYDIKGGVAETITFEATKSGTFEVVCSIQCGAGHDDMKINLVVVD